jgi:hypothetical protein
MRRYGSAATASGIQKLFSAFLPVAVRNMLKMK